MRPVGHFWFSHTFLLLYVLKATARLCQSNYKVPQGWMIYIFLPSWFQLVFPWRLESGKELIPLHVGLYNIPPASWTTEEVLNGKVC